MTGCWQKKAMILRYAYTTVYVMDSSAYSHRKGLGFMWVSSLWYVHRNPDIVYSNMLVAVLFSSGPLLILEATNCETEVAGRALCVCKNLKPAWVHPAVFPPAELAVALCVSACVPTHVGSQMLQMALSLFFRICQNGSLHNVRLCA